MDKPTCTLKTVITMWMIKKSKEKSLINEQTFM